MSLKEPHKFFKNKKEFKDWTFLTVNGNPGTTNKVKIGKDGKVGPCTGITYTQMDKMYNAFGDIDLTKCISWSYKLLWEAAERQVKQNPDAALSKAGKSGWISHWNKLPDWSGMAHFNPQDREWSQEDLLKEIFDVEGMGAVDEMDGQLIDGGGQYKTPRLFSNLNPLERKMIKRLEGKAENFAEVITVLPTLVLPSDKKTGFSVSPKAIAEAASAIAFHRNGENFPYKKFVFTPVRRHKDESFGGRPSFDQPKCPKWLDKFCFSYVEKDYYVPWHNSPVAGEQHGWTGITPYGRESHKNNKIKDITRSKNSQKRQSQDPLIQQAFEFHRGWETFDNWRSHGDTGVKDSFATKTKPYTTYYSAYNPFTTDGGTPYYTKEQWTTANLSGTPKFAQWAGDTWNDTSTVLLWQESGITNGENMLNIAKFAEDEDDLKAAWYPGGKQKYDIETIIHTLRHGPSTLDEDEKRKLKEYVDNLFSKELGMGRNPADFGTADGQTPVEKHKINKLQQGKTHENLRWYLLDPVYKVQVNKPWMMWTMRLVLYIMDCANNGVFKNLPKNAKPFTTDPKGGKYFLKFLINVIWHIFESYASIKAVNDKAQKENDKVSAKSSNVVKGKEVGKQIRKNMQCFMLNIIDHFEKYHHEQGAKEIQKYEFLRITGDNTNIFNLIGYKPRAINRMLNIKPHQLAMMQPRIKLFKERKVRKPKSKMLDTYTVEVEGPFSTHTSTANLQKMLQAGGGRSMGAGIKEIVYKSHSGDKDFETPYTTEVEITFIFNTMQEIFLNFPSFDEKGNASFPYGIDPKYASFVGSNDKEKLKRIPASYAELVFPINNKNTPFLQTISQTEEASNVILEVGWTTPEDIKKLNAEDSKFFKNMNEQTLFKSYILNPYDSEFNFTNEGQVELIARYFGIERTLEVNPKNKLFPSAGIAQNLDKPSLENNQELKKSVEGIKKLEEIQGNKGVLTRTQQTKLSNLKEIVKREVLYTKAVQYDDYVRNKLSDFLSEIFEEDQSIYTCQVPKAFLGGRKDGNVVKWSPTRDIATLRDSPRSITKGIGSAKTSLNKVKSAIKKSADENKDKRTSADKHLAAHRTGLLAKVAAGLMTQEEMKKEMEKKKAELNKSVKTATASSNIKKNATKALANYTAGFDANQEYWPIHFVYFGDLVQGMFKQSFKEYEYFAQSFDLEKSLGPKEKLNYILGTAVVPIIKGNTQIEYHINLADIPLTLHHFSNYVVEKLISPEAYRMTRFGFIQGLLRSLLREYFNSDCFTGEADIQRTSPQVVLFSMPSLSKKDKFGDGSGGVWKLSGYKGKPGDLGVKYQKEALKARMQKFEKEARDNVQNISKRPQYKYVFLGSRGLTRGTFDRKADFEDNIHHFYFGAGEGLVKNVSFKSEEMPHQTEALLLEGISAVTPQATAFIPRLFNCSLTMIGNTLFEPGHTFFVDPTMGTMIGQVGGNKNNTGINVIKDTGLGGYFYVASVETRIAPGVYETVLEGIKTGVLKKASRRKFVPASSEEMKEKKVPFTSPEDAKKKKLSASKKKKAQPIPTKEDAGAAVAAGVASGLGVVNKATRKLNVFKEIL